MVLADASGKHASADAVKRLVVPAKAARADCRAAAPSKR
jgi:hypothetical protein